MPSKLSVDQFDFDLPETLIAQTPLDKRDTSKLMVLHKNDGHIEHRHFYDIIDYLHPGDVLVLNDTRVMPARLFGIKEATGAQVEVLLLHQNNGIWECLVGNARVVKLDTVISFGEGKLKAKCVGIGEEGIRFFEMVHDGIFLEVLDELGLMPLPPYIKETLNEKERYQTVYSKHVGSVAAPTAGLHFTPELLNQLNEKGIIITYVTLHVGLGTFRPVKVDTVEDHKMHEEHFHLTKGTADVLNLAKKENRRIISVGTTSTRVLESVYNEHHTFKEMHGATRIFIYPGYQFKAIDALITNFHLPKSTLVMLVAALTSREIVLNAYKEAIEHHYRFFSFGDSMLITNE